MESVFHYLQEKVKCFDRELSNVQCSFIIKSFTLYFIAKIFCSISSFK